MVVKQVQRQQRMAKVIKNAHKDNDVERLPELWDIVDVHSCKLDIEFVDLGGKSRLRQVVLIRVDTEDAARPSALHLHRIKTGITADIEDRFSGEVFRN